MSVPYIVRESVTPARTTPLLTCPVGRWGTVMVMMVNHSTEFGPTIQVHIGKQLDLSTALPPRKLDVTKMPGDTFTVAGPMTEGDNVYVVTDSPVTVHASLVSEVIV